MKAKILTSIVILLAMAGSMLPTLANGNCGNVPGNSVFQPPQPPSPEEMAKRETEWMKNKLALSGEQLVKVDSLNMAFARKRSAIFEESQGDFENARTRMEDLRKQKKEELKKFLSAEQLNTYDEEQAARRQRRPPRDN